MRHFEGGLPSDSSDQGHCNHAFDLGRYGPPNCKSTRTSAFWASWADSLAMIHARHREVASQFVYALENDLGGPCLSVVAQARRTLTTVMGFEPPSWQAVAEGARPETQPPDEFEPGGVRPSQAGPGAGVALRVASTSRFTSIQPHLFRVVLLRRLRLLLTLSVRSLRSGWCSWAQGVCIRERFCKDLQGGWRSGRHQHFHAGHGPRGVPRTTDVWKLWLTVFLFSEGPSSQLTHALRRFSTPRSRRA